MAIADAAGDSLMRYDAAYAHAVYHYHAFTL